MTQPKAITLLAILLMRFNAANCVYNIQMRGVNRLGVIVRLRTIRVTENSKDNHLRRRFERSEMPSGDVKGCHGRALGASHGERRSAIVSAICSLTWACFGLSGQAASGTSGLRPATEDQPQIPFPDSASLKIQGATLDGLIYLKNPRSERRPTASDVVVLTVRTVEYPDTVIGGAKIPVSRIGSFPVRFQLNPSNAVASGTAISALAVWKQVMTSSDLIVKAVVCDREALMSGTNLNVLANIAACQSVDGSPPIAAQGLAKLVRLQQTNRESATTIRAPVSLPLE